jgi:DNA-binding winged helix-turn-helix (wHTH) protein
MVAPTATLGVARFGPYEVDLRSGELRKFGVRIKLGEQPLRILVLLIEHGGELVTREELRSRLWPGEHVCRF